MFITDYRGELIFKDRHVYCVYNSGNLHNFSTFDMAKTFVDLIKGSAPTAEEATIKIVQEDDYE